jgi:hypothetical protein
MKPEKQIIDAVEKAQGLLSRYIEPGPRNCEKTINELLDVLDDKKLIEAVDEVKEGRTEEAPRNSPGIEVLDETGAVQKAN